MHPRFRIWIRHVSRILVVRKKLNAVRRRRHECPESEAAAHKACVEVPAPGATGAPTAPRAPSGHAANDVCKRGDQLTVAPSEVGGCGPGDGFFVAFGDLVCSGGYLLIHEKHLCTFTEFGSDDFTWEGDRERGGRGKGAAQELRRDREIVLKAVALHGSAFQYAAEEAKKQIGREREAHQ